MALSLQEQFFQLWQANPSSTAYNAGFVTVLAGGLDARMLQNAVHLLFNQQEVTTLQF